MKRYVVSEIEGAMLPGVATFELYKQEVKDCLGCWTCWWKTPGRCIQKELDGFYKGYINSDEVVFFTKPEHGFVSAKLKTLLDRMIPLFLPYTEFRDGGTFHSVRYPKYPDIVFCYDYDFEDEEEYNLFSDYIEKVFEQFYSKKLKICSREEYMKAGVK